MSTESSVPLFGRTRTVVGARHALLAPDGHVPSAFPGWEGCTAYVLLSPAMGARLSQLLVVFQEEGRAVFSADEHEHVFYLEAGSCRLLSAGDERALSSGGFGFVPAGQELSLEGVAGTRLTVFRKVFQPHPELAPPPLLTGSADEVPDEPFLGNEGARLQTLLPVDPRFDLAMNLFTYRPGATLPFVETHIMEHGLLMLSGQGVYRLEESYYPVQAGDAIWMAPYCPQWFVAMGEAPASYLYYKDVHRMP
ncbi:MAG: (S)-ureidoglycine aminohydrolase [Verrucomicrobiota bacterium]